MKLVGAILLVLLLAYGACQGIGWAERRWGDTPARQYQQCVIHGVYRLDCGKCGHLFDTEEPWEEFCPACDKGPVEDK